MMLRFISLLKPACLVFALLCAQAIVAQPADQPALAQEQGGGKLVGWLELNDALREGPLPFAWMSVDDAGPSLSDVLKQIDTVAKGEQYLGMVVYLDQPQLTMTQVGAIADAVRAARANGKKVLAFSEVYDMRAYLIASACDEILLQHKGGVEVYGLAVEEMYLAGMLEKIGVKADLVQIGKFKGAEDPMTRTGPSPAWDETFDNLLDDMYGQMLERIMDGRRMTREQAEALVAQTWALKDTDLLRQRVVDRLTDRDMVDALDIAFGEGFAWDDAMGLAGGAAMPTNPFMLFQMLFQERTVTTTRPTIAVIHAVGPIHMGESSTGDGLFSSDAIGAKTMVRVLGEARDDDKIKGVVIRMDSPGGSALASEVIWQAVRQVAEKKPVSVSVGGVAASGGYYIACAADQIYVWDQSIIGSIGVVGGKLTLGGLYEWAGISINRRSRGQNADMFNSVEPFTAPQRELVRQAMVTVYDQFTDRVARGRGNRIADVSLVAEGRVFTGRQGVASGMADKLGGLDMALTDMAQKLDLKPGNYDLYHLPQPMSLPDFLSGLMSAQSPAMQSMTKPAGVAAGAEASAALATAKRLLGPAAWESVTRSLDGLLMLRDEPVLMLMPHAIIVK